MVRHFTLVEVIVALGILALSLVALLSLANASQQRLNKARDTWMQMHMLSQGAEYYLLHNTEEPEHIGLDFFDYRGYDVKCRYDDAQGVPDDFTDITGQEPLRCCIIELIRTVDGQVVDSLYIDRVKYNVTESN